MATQVLTQSQAPSLQVSSGSKPSLSYEELGQWETSSRVLSSLINDHMLFTAPSKCPDPTVNQNGVMLYSSAGGANPDKTKWLWVAITPAGSRLLKSAPDTEAVWPGDLAAPFFTVTEKGSEQSYSREYHPAKLVGHFRGVLTKDPVPDSLFDQVLAELSSSAANQRESPQPVHMEASSHILSRRLLVRMDG